MSETRTEREPRLLQSIPQDILRQIASLIDKRSAQALATTCKSLREAGEMRIWERIRLLHFAPGEFCVTILVFARYMTCADLTDVLW
jgi:hypothetical protein